jgi:hypothetical protein
MPISLQRPTIRYLGNPPQAPETLSNLAAPLGQFGP